jgi:hypothetical protein
VEEGDEEPKSPTGEKKRKVRSFIEWEYSRGS